MIRCGAIPGPCPDRRGVGRTLRRNGRAGSDEWTFGLLASDGIEVAEYLRRHLGHDTVIVLGHSQGTIVDTDPELQAPAKNLVLLPGGGHCAVLMQPAAFLAGLRACLNGMPAGTSGPGRR